MYLEFCWLSSCVYCFEVVDCFFFVFGLYSVCLLFLEVCPHLHLSILLKKNYHLLLIYGGKSKLVPHICSHWPGAMRRPDSVTAGRMVQRRNQSEGMGLKHFAGDLLVWIGRIWVNLWVRSALLVYSELWRLVEPNCDWLCQAEAEFSAYQCFYGGEKGEWVEGK